MPESRTIDNELTRLHAMLVDMAEVVDEQLSITADALREGDVALAERVKLWDDKVDALELAIDKQYEQVLALKQPVAVDLRFLIVAAKINKDLERIGDQCKNVANSIACAARMPELLGTLRMDEMAERTRAMLRRAMDAFTHRDRDMANQVMAMDEQLDALYDSNLRSLISYAQRHGDQFEAIVHLVLVNKAWERMGDHAKNICEDVVFLVDAVDVRHGRR
jgi:phosphate transport system protein